MNIINHSHIQEVKGSEYGVISVQSFDNSKLSENQLARISKRIFSMHGKEIGRQIKKSLDLLG